MNTTAIVAQVVWNLAASPFLIVHSITSGQFRARGADWMHGVIVVKGGEG